MPAAILEAVLGNLAVAGGVAVVALAVGRWAHRPAVAHVLWLLVLLKLLTPPLVTIPIACLPARHEASATAPTVRPTPAASPVLTPIAPVEFKPIAPVLPTHAVPASAAVESAKPSAASAPIPAASATIHMPSW